MLNQNKINQDKGLTLSEKAEPIYTDSSLVSSEPSVGDLFWAKAPGHAWWPCMITSFPPPINMNQIELPIDSKDHIKIVDTKKMFCVLLFGTSLEYAWISDTSFIDYKGFELFKANAQKQVNLASSKSDKKELADKFQIKFRLSRREEWKGAVEEADKFLDKSAMERKKYFIQKFMSTNKNSVK